MGHRQCRQEEPLGGGRCGSADGGSCTICSRPVFVEQCMVYSIYYMNTLVLPCIGERRRLLMRDGSGRRTRDVIHIRCMGIGIYTKYIT